MNFNYIDLVKNLNEEKKLNGLQKVLTLIFFLFNKYDKL